MNSVHRSFCVSDIVNPLFETRSASKWLSGGKLCAFIAFLQRIWGSAFTIRFWDDSLWLSNPAQPSSFEFWLRTHTAWRQLLHTDDELSIDRSYIEGELRIEGNLFLALRSLPAMQQAARHAGLKPRAAMADLLESARLSMGRLAHWGTEHSRGQDAAAIAFHDDKPTAFYRLLLGPAMVYSCACSRREES